MLCLWSHRLQDFSSSCFGCLPPACCGFFFVFGSRISLFVGSSLFFFFFFFFDGCEASSCDFDVSLRGGKLRSFYSALLSSDPIKLLVFFAMSSFTCSQGSWTELRGLLPANSSTIPGEKQICHLVMYAEAFPLFLHSKQTPLSSHFP